MAKKNKAKPAAEKIDTSPAGLEVTEAPDLEMLDGTEMVNPEYATVESDDADAIDADGMPMEDNLLPEVADVVVSADVSSNPMQSIAATLVACGRMYEDAGKLSVALTKWLPGVAAQPELHSFLQRMQIAMGELRHAIKQNEDMISDELREAIVEAVS